MPRNGPAKSCTLYSVTNLNSFVFRCCAPYALSRVSPASDPPPRPTLLILANKHTKIACLFCNHPNHTARGVPAQAALVRTPLWLTMMKAFPSGNGLPDPKLANGNASGKLALCPQVSICASPPRPPSNGHFIPQLERSDYVADEGW
ncbi:hypothetical protein O181_103991 [Austropuccinia psidii MF-1]|uniref:Uncharacterized protein n=1 Tax=Austropuccinia psidii MF-1 TaxID=1389203 RepID=A0A9Q3PL02_9BASI|nr:hypothetical protein [Austropuccinia psidii MF-1]